MTSRIRIVLPMLIAAATMSSIANAQTADKAAPPAPDAAATAQSRGPSPETMQRLLDGRIAMAKATLKMTDAQLKLWTPVEDLMRARQAARVKSMQDRKAQQGGTATRPSLTERMEANSTRMARRAEDAKTFAAVFKPFYESLTEPQKAVAGPLLAEFNGGGWHMHGHRWAEHRGSRMSRQ